MRTEDTTVSVKFVDHHKFQILEESHPLRMMGKNARMKHIRVGDHNISLGANGLSGILRGISIISESGHRFSDPLNQVLELEHLVLGKGFCWKEIKGL